jgi:hypothetical protein
MSGEGVHGAQWKEEFAPADDGPHDPGDDFYHNETFWFSFFVPERGLGAWLYSGIRSNAGVTSGGLWLWDRHGTAPWEIPFYEQFSWLKPPASADARRLVLANGNSVTTVEPGMVYDLTYDDRQRMTAELRFAGLERPVPLRPGTPPYPKASHYDQTGRVSGHVVLDGERIAVDCYAMRDRSWGTRKERGYRPVGYTWLAGADQSVLVYSKPTAEGKDEIYTGYLRRGDKVSYVASGLRSVRRDPEHGWITGIDLELADEDGRRFSARGDAVSRTLLPHATSVCAATLIDWTAGETRLSGEDQDVWPLHEWRTLIRRR